MVFGYNLEIDSILSHESSGSQRNPFPVKNQCRIMFYAIVRPAKAPPSKTSAIEITYSTQRLAPSASGSLSSKCSKRLRGAAKAVGTLVKSMRATATTIERAVSKPLELDDMPRAWRIESDFIVVRLRHSAMRSRRILSEERRWGGDSNDRGSVKSL